MAPTIGIEFACKEYTLKDGSKIKIQFFDTAGQEKYKSIVSNYCRKALGCLLVFDITKKSTFESCREFITTIKQIAEPDCVIFLVGNKTDLEESREVQQEEAKKFAAENKIYFIETSAANNSCVKEAFEKLFECINTETKKKVNYQSNNEYIQITKRKGPVVIHEDKNTCC